MNLLPANLNLILMTTFEPGWSSIVAVLRFHWRLLSLCSNQAIASCNSLPILSKMAATLVERATKAIAALTARGVEVDRHLLHGHGARPNSRLRCLFRRLGIFHTGAGIWSFIILYQPQFLWLTSLHFSFLSLATAHEDNAKSLLKSVVGAPTQEWETLPENLVCLLF